VIRRSSIPACEPSETPRGERGAALLVAMLTAVFLTILGLVLVEILRGGLSQAASTEASIQAEALAQRGMDDAVALIWNEVNDANLLSDMHQRVVTIEQALQSLRGKLHGKNVQGERGTYTIEIAGDVGNYDDYEKNRIMIPDYPYSRILTVKVTATAGTLRKRTAVREADIFVTTINPVFKYPLSARDYLELNGAVYVVGDVLVRSHPDSDDSDKGNIYVYDKAYFIGSPGTLYGMETAPPTVKGFYKADAVIRQNRVETPSTEEEGDKFSAFEPFQDPEMPEDEDIPVGILVGAKVDEMNNLLDLEEDPFDITIEEDQLEGYTVSGSVTTGTRYLNQWVRLENEVSIKHPGNGSAHFAVDNGVLWMDGGARVTLSNGSLYVRYDNPFIAAATFAGALVVEPPHAVVVKGDVVMMDGFRFSGKMYVEGSLQIVGSVNLEGTIHVKGDVDLKEMRSLNDGAGSSGSSAPLILLSSGGMIFSDVRPDENDENAKEPVEPIRVRAFLYSEQPLSLYGVLSKMIITGGIHGSSVSINAVREDPTDRSNGVYFEVVGNPEDSFHLTPSQRQLQLSPDASNLQIFYDHQLFTDPPVGIPVTDHLTMFVQSRVAG